MASFARLSSFPLGGCSLSIGMCALLEGIRIEQLESIATTSPRHIVVESGRWVGGQACLVHCTGPPGIFLGGQAFLASAIKLDKKVLLQALRFATFGWLQTRRHDCPLLTQEERRQTTTFTIFSRKAMANINLSSQLREKDNTNANKTNAFTQFC